MDASGNGSSEQQAVLIAQRRLIESLEGLLREASRDRVCLWLLDREVPRDGQEDPGAVLGEGSAEILALTAAYRDIARTLGCRH